MQLRYDEAFLESAVFLAASGRRRGAPPLQVARFHRERERLYVLLDPDERDAAFFRLHLEWFREWGLEQPLLEQLAERPLLRTHLDTLALRQAAGRTDEGAELYVNERGQRTGLLALRLERLLDAATLPTYLRHEFTHLQDMLDPAFGYTPTLDLPGLNPAQRRLATERYRLLWDITIDGRLATTGRHPMHHRSHHAAAFDRGYPFWSDAKRAQTFDTLWNHPSPRHADLLALITDPRGLDGVRQPAPGGSCPLCDFPTFDWAPDSALPEAVTRRILAEFPTWAPAHGLCRRCLESYQTACLPAWVRPAASTPTLIP